MWLDLSHSHLPESWTATTIGAECDAHGGNVQTGPFGSQLHASDYVAEGIPSIMPHDFGQDRGDTSAIARIPEEDAIRLSKYWVEPGDIVYSRRGDVERRALVTNREAGWLCGTGCLRVRLYSPNVDPRYFYYYLGHPDIRSWIVRHAHGATMLNLNTKILREVPLVYPPLDEQRRIAAVLGALDDRIEVNRRMNRTLEAMAQALFRSRFMDFDGRDDLVETEAGPIPSGWRWGTFGEVARQHSDTVHPDDVDPDTLHIGLSDMPPGSIALDSWGTAADVSSGKARFDRGDILFGKLRPYFKKVGVAPRDGICSSDILVVRPKTQAWYGLTLGLLTYDPFIDFTEKVSTGTRMPRVSWKAMAGYEMALPPEEEAAAFDAFIRPTVGRILANIEHSRTLAALRDALLPKLVSGEIRVPEAEEAAEAVL